eukprot:gene5563-9381_t
MTKEEELKKILPQKKLEQIKKVTSLDLSLMFFEELTLEELISELLNKLKQDFKVDDLNLQSNELSTVPFSVSKMNLKTLLLGKNNFSTFPSEFLSKQKTLKQVFLNNNLLSGSDWFSSDENFQLEVLDLSFNKIVKFPLSFGEQIDISKLIDLRLSSNKLNEFPDFLKNCSNLMILHLDTNEIVDFEGIEGMTSLMELKLEENQLKRIPKGISACQKLKRLFLNTNQIDELSDEIFKLGSLEVLTLHSNDIQKIGSEIKKMKCLTHLNLHQNKISKLPNEICQLPLQEFTVFRNQLTEIPDNIYELDQLKCLYLQQNQIKTLPDGMQKMINLEEIDLFENQLKNIPNWIGNLTHLKKLSLESNDLKILPGEIKLLRELVDLNVENNPNLLE